MKPNLKMLSPDIYHIIRGERVNGAPADVIGDLSGVRGDLTGVRGNLRGVTGDLSAVCGNLTGVTGDLSDVWGDLDTCGITRADRARGVHIWELIERAGDKQ